MSQPLKCPSAQPDMEGAQVLGVVEQDAGHSRLAYVAGELPVNDDLLQATGDLPPTLVYRFAAGCAEKKCQHFDGAECQLATRIARDLDPVVASLPVCAIRKTCRWHNQEGAAACHRCPGVVTQLTEPDDEMLRIARPA